MVVLGGGAVSYERGTPALDVRRRLECERPHFRTKYWSLPGSCLTSYRGTWLIRNRHLQVSLASGDECYYDLLAVEKDATDAQIKKGYPAP